MNLLFVCDKNSWRSRTAENIFGRLLPHQARSAGTNMGARAIVTNELLSWADMVFVMEEKDQRALTEGFTATMFGRRIIVLDIPDRYDFMDEELILMLKTTVAPYLEEPMGR